METTYPFPRTVKVEAGATIAIWSSGGEVEHKPKEGQYVMKVGFFSSSTHYLLAKLNFDVLGGHMEDGGFNGVGAVHKGGRGDGDQGRTEGKGQFWFFKVGVPEIVTIQ